MESGFLVSVVCMDNDKIGRVEYCMLPIQTLMELLVDEFRNKSRLTSPDSLEYLDLEQWIGVHFCENGEIAEVCWREQDGSPSPTGGILHIQWMPSTVRKFSLTGSMMEGSVDMSQLPEVLKKLYLQRNRLSGTVDLSCLSTKMNTLILHTNQFSGIVHILHLPLEMRYLYLSMNKFIGTVVLGEIPRLCIIKLSDNLFEAVIDESGASINNRQVLY